MLLYSVLYICFAACLFPAISGSQHKQELKDHFEHITRVSNFECSAPQPRLLTVKELFTELFMDYQLQGKAYFPEVTVLHRCDRHVGSCDDATFSCGPAYTTNVSLPFKITFLEDIGSHAKGQWMMEYHDLVNHTSCACVKTNTLPPFPVPRIEPTPTADDSNDTDYVNSGGNTYNTNGFYSTSNTTQIPSNTDADRQTIDPEMFRSGFPKDTNNTILDSSQRR